MNPHDKSQLHTNPLYTTPIAIGGISIRPLDLFEHVLATGGTGSGKTRSFILPLVEQMLRRFGTDPGQKTGMLLLDAKGDMADLATECIRRAGRSEDLYVLGEGGNCWFSLFEQFDGDPTAVANFLMETLEDRYVGRRGENDSFWEENARRLLRTAAVCAKAEHGIGLGGLSGISTAIELIMGVRGRQDDDESSSEEDEGAKATIDTLLEKGLVSRCLTWQEKAEVDTYIKNDVIPGASRTWATIANMARNYISQFSQPHLRALFEEGEGRRKLSPEDIIDEGLLVIVSLSPVVFGNAALPFRTALKKAFCERVLQRNHLVKQHQGSVRQINQNRPLLLVMDEFHTVINARGRSSDAYFLDRAREFRCGCILATQGISAISSVIDSSPMRNHLLNNCRTKFFFANDCPETIEYFEFIGGMEEKEVTSIHYERVPPPPRFRLPNHTFVAPRDFGPARLSVDQRKQPRFSGAELGSLPSGSAMVVGKGRTLSRFTLDPAGYAAPTPEEVTL